MSLFKYTVLTIDGQKESGEIESDSIKSAKRQLQQKGLFVQKIYAVDGSFSFEKLKQLSLKDILAIEIGVQKLKEVELVAFSRQFATLIQANIPILSALDAILEGTTDKTLKRILSVIRSKINEGSSLSDAMEEHKIHFGGFYVNMVRAAETSGTLGSVLNTLSNRLEKQSQLIGQVKSALSYPAIMLIVGLGVVAFLLTNVVPNITSMFTNTGHALPQLTQIMLSISHFLVHYGLFILILLFLAIFFMAFAIKRSEKIAYLWDVFYLRLPIIGMFGHKTAHSRFCGTLASLLSAGVPITLALTIAERVTPFLPYKEALTTVQKEVQEGASLGEALKQTKLFPSLILNMIIIGEKAGRLEEMLLNVSQTIDIDLETRLTGLSRLIQPLLLIVMGSLIAFVMGAVLIPIFELNNLAGGL